MASLSLTSFWQFSVPCDSTTVLEVHWRRWRSRLAGILGIALMVVAGKIRPGVLVFCLYGIALAVLYMTSLRGWYTTGHDIQVEFRVFSLVHAHQHWSVGSAGTSYNACLSITILPQMLWELTRVATPYVFKTDFPLIFVACPLALYELSRRMLGQRLAVASALLFISFPTFVNDMVFINRQEVAFLFVSVVLALMFCGGFDLRTRRIIIRTVHRRHGHVALFDELRVLGNHVGCGIRFSSIAIHRPIGRRPQSPGPRKNACFHQTRTIIEFPPLEAAGGVQLDLGRIHLPSGRGLDVRGHSGRSRIQPESSPGPRRFHRQRWFR